MMAGRPTASRAAPTATTTSSSPQRNALLNSSMPVAPLLSMSSSTSSSSSHNNKPLSSARSAQVAKNYGPPTLQSDTVVFQAAKIPLSSSRHGSQPGPSAGGGGGPGGAAVGGGGGGRASSPYQSREDRGNRGDLYRGLGLYGGPSPSHHNQQQQQQYEQHPRSVERARPRAPGEQPFQHHQQQQQHHHHQPRSPPREREQRSGGGLRGGSNGSNNNQETTTTEAEGEFTHLLRQDKPRKTPSRASSGDNQKATASAAANVGHRRGVQLTISVQKVGDKLGFGIRNDSNRKLKVSTLQSNTMASKSSLRIGDTLLSVNGVNLRNLGFLEVIQQLKATKPGELVFEIERIVDDKEEDDGQSGLDGLDQLSGAESSGTGDGSQPGETTTVMMMMDVDGGGGGSTTHSDSTATAPIDPARHNVAHQQQQPPPPPMAVLAAAGAAMQRDHLRSPSPLVSSTSGASPSVLTEHQQQLQLQLQQQPPPRKRPRASAVGMTPNQLEMELVRMEKQHKAVVNALSLELKKEQTEKRHLEDKNVALRKRLQNMLIECDEVRVQASTNVAASKDHAQREIQQLTLALHESRARLRLVDRGPDVSRMDSIANDLVVAKEQLTRVRKQEADRSALLASRFSLESRQAEREALRTREALITRFQSQLREIARRNYNNSGNKTGGRGGGGGGGGGAAQEDAAAVVKVQYDGLRRLAFAKLFGTPSSYEWYSSEAFLSSAVEKQLLHKQDDVLDVFGSQTLCHEERTGLFLVAVAPMNITYDPVAEKLTLSCGWDEQNQIRELARNFRF